VQGLEDATVEIAAAMSKHAEAINRLGKLP
jgi:hypothetical protein